MNGEEHSAVLCDFKKGEALSELDNHVFKVTALHKLWPEGDAGACFENAQASSVDIEVGHAAYSCGQEVKVECCAVVHSCKKGVRRVL